MLRHLTKSTAFATAVAAAVLLPGASARARVADPVGWEGVWTTPSCAEGGFTSAARDGFREVMVFGDAGLCAGTVAPKAVFGVAVYHVEDPAAKAYARDDRARYFYPSGRRAFGIRVSFEGESEAICLLSSPTNRLACAIVKVEGSKDGIIFVPLSTDDPLVSEPAKWGHTDPAARHDTKPECATCF